MDHFARPDDELAIAQREGTLYRNFQGYSTHAHCDLIGLGITSIGMVGPSYSQNVKTLDEYYDYLDRGELAVVKGMVLSQDDQIRRDVITQLICNFMLDFGRIEQAWGIDFRRYFAAELDALEPMLEDKLLARDAHGVSVLPKGRLLIRNICMQFDAYLQPAAERQNFSRVI